MLLRSLSSLKTLLLVQWPPAWLLDGLLAGKQPLDSCRKVLENLDTSEFPVAAPATAWCSEAPSPGLDGATRLAQSLCKEHQRNDERISFVLKGLLASEDACGAHSCDCSPVSRSSDGRLYCTTFTTSRLQVAEHFAPCLEQNGDHEASTKLSGMLQKSSFFH